VQTQQIQCKVGHIDKSYRTKLVNNREVCETCDVGKETTTTAPSCVRSCIGDIGVYQLRATFVVLLASALASDPMHIIFIGADMPHWCRVPALDALPYDVQKNVAIPAQSTDDDGSVEYSSCEMFSLNYSEYNRSEFYSWKRRLMVSENTSVVPCSEWTYDQSQFISTIVSEVHSYSSLRLNAYTTYIVSSPTVSTKRLRQDH